MHVPCIIIIIEEETSHAKAVENVMELRLDPSVILIHQVTVGSGIIRECFRFSLNLEDQRQNSWPKTDDDT